EGVGAVGVDDIDGVNAVAFGFGHGAAFAILDHGVDVDVFKGNVAVAVEAEHDHTCDPEGEDVAGGGEYGGRVEVGEELVFGFFGGAGVGPAHGGDWPECGGEPGVEDVGVLGVAHFDDGFFDG